jgi:hypothetical protein
MDIYQLCRQGDHNTLKKILNEAKENGIDVQKNLNKVLLTFNKRKTFLEERNYKLF